MPFVEKPSLDPSDVDYVPTIFCYSNKEASIKRKQSEKRYQLITQKRLEAAAISESQGSDDTCIEVNTESDKEESDTNVEVGIQTDELLRTCKYGCDLIKDNDTATKFYTGLPSWDMYMLIFNFTASYIPRIRKSRSKLTLLDELLMVLMRLRLNLLITDLSYRFEISNSTVTSVFHQWIEILYLRLKFLVMWPSRDILQHNIPQIFTNARCIIDCFEIFMERPYSFEAQAQTFSNYKKHNTVKVLIGISPCGTISFLSKCWGGRVTDKFITRESGFLKLIDPSDVIIADRGFDIADDIALHGGKLEIPSFTKGKKQLSQKEVETSQKISKVRIHVERVIGLLKNKYTILQDVLPVSLVSHKDKDNSFSTLDKLIVVCASLTNLSPSVVT